MVANIQIRGVPEQVHRQLKSQAALSRASLNELLLARDAGDDAQADTSRS